MRGRQTHFVRCRAGTEHTARVGSDVGRDATRAIVAVRSGERSDGEESVDGIVLSRGDQFIRSPTICKLLRAGAFYGEVDIPPNMIESIQGMTHRAYAKTASGSLEFIRRHSVPERLAALGVPVQVIFGVEDRRCHSGLAMGEYRAIPDVQTALMNGIGHTPMLEDPEATGRLLSDFLRSHARSDSCPS